jgi:5'-nucleotidase
VRGLAVSLDVALHPTGGRHWDAADELFPRVLELLLDAPAGTSLSLNVPDGPPAEHRELRHARLAEFGSVQARVDEVEDGGLRLGEIEVGTAPEEGTDGALLAAGHPTLTALRSVSENEGRLVPEWLARSKRVRA